VTVTDDSKILVPGRFGKKNVYTESNTGGTDTLAR